MAIETRAMQEDSSDEIEKCEGEEWEKRECNNSCQFRKPRGII